MKITIICPTYNRPERHANLYAVFNHQNYSDKELLVMDDSAEKSPFFAELQDDRVTYLHLTSSSTIGHKRNLMADIAKGEVIAHFDDDDYYAPDYLQTMLQLIDCADSTGEGATVEPCRGEH